MLKTVFRNGRVQWYFNNFSILASTGYGCLFWTQNPDRKYFAENMKWDISVVEPDRYIISVRYDNLPLTIIWENHIVNDNEIVVKIKTLAQKYMRIYNFSFYFILSYLCTTWEIGDGNKRTFPDNKLFKTKSIVLSPTTERIRLSHDTRDLWPTVTCVPKSKYFSITSFLNRTKYQRHMGFKIKKYLDRDDIYLPPYEYEWLSIKVFIDKDNQLRTRSE